MSKREKNLVVVAAIMIVLLLAVGGTYAYWTTTQVQDDVNKIDTTCLKVQLLNQESADESAKTTEGITLNKAYPISDDAGKTTTGYTFTIKNNCETDIKYDINLESLKIGENEYTAITESGEEKAKKESESSYLQSEYIDTYITKDNVSVLKEPEIKKLNAFTNANKSYLNGTTFTSYEQKNLINKETLSSKGSVTYTLRLWVDKDAPMTQMEKQYQGKVVVYSWLGNSNPETIELEG